MNSRAFRTFVLLMAVVFVTTPSLLAQKVEINPYGGFIWPSGTNVGHLKDQAIYGVRAGFFLDPSFELEGNFGYLNHFEPRDIDPESRGWLWELAGTYNFSERDWYLPANFTPTLSVGVGAITTKLDGNATTFNRFGSIQLQDGTSLGTVTPYRISDGDTFMTMSFGGGIKSNRLWGPVGLRADVRGRFLPNYYGSSPIWLEAVAGITFGFGAQ